MDYTAEPLIKVGVIRGYGNSDWPKIRVTLQKWENEGILKILNDPEGRDASEPCVQMLKYIDQRSSIPGFLNWEESS